MPDLLPLVTPCFTENHSLDTMDSAKVAELKAIWTAKAEQCYYRAQFMKNFSMPIARTPSPDFIYIKDAIMYAIKPYTNIRALGIQDMGIATAYNRVSSNRDYLIAHSLFKLISVLTSRRPSSASLPENGSHAKISHRCYATPYSTRASWAIASP
ncbi:MAG: hypothetical protein Q9198_010263 [Flavoplaca austrocitrina]